MTKNHIEKMPVFTRVGFVFARVGFGGVLRA